MCRWAFNTFDKTCETRRVAGGSDFEQVSDDICLMSRRYRETQTSVVKFNFSLQGAADRLMCELIYEVNSEEFY